MPNLTIGIQVDDLKFYNDENEIYLDAKSTYKLQIPADKKVSLEFGALKGRVRVKKQYIQQSLLRINQSLAERLRVPNGTQMHIRYDEKTKVIKLGPILGILISKYNTQNPKEPFGILNSFCTEAIAAARQKGVHSYVFTLNDVHYDSQTVKGWYYRSGRWKRTLYPLPDCIYNRLSSRREEKKLEVRNQLMKLKSFQIPIFNEMFLDKWKVYQALSASPQARTYIPYTELYRGYSTIKSFLQRYSFIYIKPTNGSMGQGIFRLSKKGRSYLCQYSTMNGSINKTFSSVGSLTQQLSSRLSRRPYLVQQGLVLVKQNGSPVDFRSLVQKDRKGNWSITSIVARTGAANSIVSNIAQGGSMNSARKILSPSSSWPISQFTSYRDLSHTSKAIATALENVMPGHYAELGIDLAVDTSGKTWLLEVNSKPSKTEDTIVEEKRVPRPSVLRLFDYALHLENFTKNGTSKRPLHRIHKQKKKNQRKLG